MLDVGKTISNINIEQVIRYGYLESVMESVDGKLNKEYKQLKEFIMRF